MRLTVKRDRGAGAAGKKGVKVAGSAAEANPQKSDNTFFLDADPDPKDSHNLQDPNTKFCLWIWIQI